MGQVCVPPHHRPHMLNRPYNSMRGRNSAGKLKVSANKQAFYQQIYRLVMYMTANRRTTQSRRALFN
jgi:hypothetical protein